MWANICWTPRRERPKQEMLSKYKQPIFRHSEGLDISHYDQLHSNWIIDSEHHESTHMSKILWAACEEAGSHPISMWVISFYHLILHILAPFTFPTQYPIRFAAWHDFFIDQQTHCRFFNCCSSWELWRLSKITKKRKNRILSACFETRLHAHWGIWPKKQQLAIGPQR